MSGFRPIPRSSSNAERGTMAQAFEPLAGTLAGDFDQAVQANFVPYTGLRKTLSAKNEHTR